MADQSIIPGGEKAVEAAAKNLSLMADTYGSLSTDKQHALVGLAGVIHWVITSFTDSMMKDVAKHLKANQCEDFSGSN